MNWCHPAAPHFLSALAYAVGPVLRCIYKLSL
jgi:hypothetical protein